MSCLAMVSSIISAFHLSLTSSVISNERKLAPTPTIFFDRMNAGEEHAPLTKDVLREILDYAVNAKYVSNSTYNDNISYRINDKQIDGECTICGENLYIYTPETFRPKRRSIMSTTTLLKAWLKMLVF